ncbi:MAG TPA: hypothetical protein PK175_00625 [Syntrophales bacterium]|jgi:hypothetical protein|nr:hypothetical protein [Syntrophales bacterium]HON23297.1 hypothetical protein [Syntrophales bacterium]HOU76697.1 hypothetical protein [Syntrophales bacterium]HPC31454.1 hypothetical protein [Syntrophales bacterium]HQG33361.1 hypothetical protein [Syntrophales bacterium]
MAARTACYRENHFPDAQEYQRVTNVKAKRGSVADNIRYLVLETDWDEELIRRQTLLNRFCKGVLGIAVLYFLPVMMNIFWR